MKIVIDISEETYNSIKNEMRNRDAVAEVGQAVEDGTPLPKGHGDLIDINNINEITLADSLYIMSHTKGDEVDWYIDAPIIVQADKE